MATAPLIAPQTALREAFEQMKTAAFGELDIVETSRGAGIQLSSDQVIEAEIGPGEEPGAVSAGVLTRNHNTETTIVSEEAFGLQRRPSGLVTVYYLSTRPLSITWAQAQVGLRTESEQPTALDDFDEDMEKVLAGLMDPVDAFVNMVVSGTLRATNAHKMSERVYGPAQFEVDTNTLEVNVGRFILAFKSK